MPTQAAVIRKNYPAQTRTFLILSLVILAAGSVYGFLQYQKLSSSWEALGKGQEMMASLQNDVESQKQATSDLEKSVQEDANRISNMIADVFPPTESYKELTRMLEEYSLQYGTRSDPLFINSLSFSQPLYDVNKEYSVLPFSISMDMSNSNFDRFLRFVNTSGDFEEKVRLMEIKNFSFTYPQAEEETIQTTEGETVSESISMSFAMDAYFQKPSTYAQQPAVQ